ncbi:MAG: TraM recognition domain-containing protein [Gammaproteobacteria bacterium]
MQQTRGLAAKHEHAASLIARDTRPIGTRIAEWVCNPIVNLSLFLTLGVSCFLYPIACDVTLIISAVLFLFIKSRPVTLPFKLPISSRTKDYNNTSPGSYKPNLAAGISFFGNELSSNQELWFTNEDLRTHALIFGSTGSGKTEALISIAFNSLIHGSGFIYIDGKGDNSLFAKIFSMVRKMGRDDDLLLINFMTGARDIIGPQKNRLSNTMNPFANGSSSMLSQLIISLMDASSNDQTGDMWKGRAINFVQSLMVILCAMRDAGHILLDANSIREYFLIEKLESIVIDLKFPTLNNLYVPLDTLPSKTIDPLKNYLLNLPGYNAKNKFNQTGEVREQHGFITMQLTRVFGSLADTYGHIIRTNLAEVDVKDVVLNRRILIVLLPALEKAPEELANLGKIIIASLKTMMAAGLGDQVEGKYIDVISSKPTNATAPFVSIMDEYGYYAVKGFAIVAAQARSLGFSAIFAGQDLPAFQKASKEEAASIGANCNIKICMKLEDPLETWDYFNKTAGETYVTNVNSFQLHSGSVALNYMDSRSTSVDRRQRIELLDLKDQREGEAHIFFKSKIIRAAMFFANPKPVVELKLNQLLKVDKPDEAVVINILKRINSFSEVLNKPVIYPKVEQNENISCIQLSLLESSSTLSPIERIIEAIAVLLEQQIEKHLSIDHYYASLDSRIRMNAFTKLSHTHPCTEQLLGNNLTTFKMPLLKASNILEIFKQIEYLSGSSIEHAEKISQNLLSRIETISSFPPNKDAISSNWQPKFKESLDDILKLFKLDPINIDAKTSDLPELPPIIED